MNREELNEREWKDPRNWHGGIFGVYRSERDTRLFVPKRKPWMGWTLNFARPGAFLFLGTILGGVLLVVVVVVVLAGG